MDHLQRNIESGNWYADGRYILPLPIRKSDLTMPFNCKQALKRASKKLKNMIASDTYPNDYTIFLVIFFSMDMQEAYT